MPLVKLSQNDRLRLIDRGAGVGRVSHIRVGAAG